MKRVTHLARKPEVPAAARGCYRSPAGPGSRGGVRGCPCPRNSLSSGPQMPRSSTPPVLNALGSAQPSRAGHGAHQLPQQRKGLVRLGESPGGFGQGNRTQLQTLGGVLDLFSCSVPLGGYKAGQEPLRGFLGCCPDLLCHQSPECHSPLWLFHPGIAALNMFSSFSKAPEERRTLEE